MNKEKLTLIKVGGKIVEEEETLKSLLRDFSHIEGFNMAEDVLQLNWRAS